MNFDFTDTATEFPVIDPGRYNATLHNIGVRVKEQTRNTVLDVDLLLQGGQYDQTNVRYFHTVTDNPKSKYFLLKLFTNLGFIQEGDRKENGQLITKLDLVNSERPGTKTVTNVIVNGQKRKINTQQKVIVVITNQLNRDGVNSHWVTDIVSYDRNSKTVTVKEGDDSGDLPF